MSSSDSNETKKYDNMNKSVGTSISSLTESGGYQPLQPGDIGINIGGNQSFRINTTNPFHNRILTAINLVRNSVPIQDLTGIVPPQLERNLTNENLNGIYTNLNRIIESVGEIYDGLNSSNPNPNPNPNPNSSNPNSNLSNLNSSNPNSSNSSEK